MRASSCERRSNTRKASERQQQQTRDVCSSLSLDLRAKVTQLMALAQKHDGLKIALLTVWGGQRAKPCTIVV